MSNIRCYRCGRKIKNHSRSITWGDRTYGICCYEKINKRMRVRKSLEAKNNKFIECENCEEVFLSEKLSNLICANKCCFCCMYSDMKFNGEKCELETKLSYIRSMGKKSEYKCPDCGNDMSVFEREISGCLRCNVVRTRY